MVKQLKRWSVFFSQLIPTVLQGSCFVFLTFSAERCIAKKYGAEMGAKVKKKSAFSLAYVLIEGELLKIIPYT